jgi:uncharacterized membrane protein HdeD (DUF308 family)
MKAEIEIYKNNWWMFLIGGIVTLLFGIVTIINPGQTLLSLSFFFGLYLLIRGVLEIVISLVSSKQKKLWFVNIVLGALEAGIGIYLLQRPLLVLKSFVVFVALALLIRGVIHFIEALDSKYPATFRTWQIIAAVASVLAATLVWRYPVQGTLAFVWVIGVYAIITGPLMIAFALEARDGFKK